MWIRLLRWAFGSHTQPDVLVALLLADVAWNLVVPDDVLAAHDDRIGIQPELRPWLLPIKCAAIVGLLVGKRRRDLGVLTARAAMTLGRAAR